jgi:hypothetical protein
MRTPAARRRLVAALTLTVAAALTGCGGEPLAPLPVQAAGPASGAPVSRTASVRPNEPAATTAGTPPRGAAPATTRRPAPAGTTTRAGTTTPPTEDTTNCHGAGERREVNLQETVLDLLPPMCFHTGGTLRLYNAGPGEVTATPENLRTKRYAAAVHDVYFIRPGTVDVAVTLDGQTQVITVVVIE